MKNIELANRLKEALCGLEDTEEILAIVRGGTMNHKVTFSTSFGAEDQVLTYFLYRDFPECSFFTLDTGRMFQETYDTYDRTRNKYKIEIVVHTPKSDDLKELYSHQGPNGFYDSVVKRKTCCDTRKIKPLREALSGQSIWITGLRAEQSDNRKELNIVEYDEGFDIVKVHPLLFWSWEKVLAFADENGVPVNPLHKKGFPSIGCAPCTRRVEVGENFRDGRWWWESSSKECGLHQG